MAKSRFEAKKIVRYTDNDVNRIGISGRPTPRIQISTSGGVTAGDSVSSDLGNVDTGTGTGLGSGTGTSDTPPPPPPPPGPKETRAFLFDGNTKLTSSLDPLKSSDNFIGSGTIFTTFSPGWAQNETGSFTLFSVGRPQDAAASTWKVLIKEFLGVMVFIEINYGRS